MFRSRGENIRAVYILLFLNVAFFLLEHQDPDRFKRLFAFDWGAVRGGQVWRLVTYQFTQAGSGFMAALALFITLLLLYMMGSALEEEWGSLHFLTLWALSTLGSAGVAALLGIPLFGTYFVYFTLLFVYASAFPQQTFYLFGMIPIQVRVLAIFALAVLLYGVFAGGEANVAAFGGAVIGFAYYLFQRSRIRFVPPAQETPDGGLPVRIDTTAIHNAARFATIKQTLAAREDDEIERLLSQCDRDVVPGVNICPPPDYKPEDRDGYCIRCEGFAECSARYLRLNRPRPSENRSAALGMPNPDVP
jgi:rhomboid family protein